MKANKFFKVCAASFLALSFFVMLPQAVMANVAVVKVYKAAFDGDKPKCSTCHVDKNPKKEDGKHDLNDYGKKVLAAKNDLKKETVDEDVLKKAGKGETEE